MFECLKMFALVALLQQLGSCHVIERSFPFHLDEFKDSALNQRSGHCKSNSDEIKQLHVNALKSKDPRESIGYCLNIQEIDPQFCYGHGIIVVRAISIGDFDRALNECDWCLTNSPDKGDILESFHSRIKILKALGRRDELAQTLDFANQVANLYKDYIQELPRGSFVYTEDGYQYAK